METLYGGQLTGSQILKEIEAGNITIDPFDPKMIGPNSFDLTLNNTIKVYKNKVLDFKGSNPTEEFTITEEGFVLLPGKLYLGRTNERCFTDKFVPHIDGRSSVGRLGILVHMTAGRGDIGFSGTWTLEITCFQPVRIYPNIPFAQISFYTPCGESDILYNGRYQGQIDVTATRSQLQRREYV